MGQVSIYEIDHSIFDKAPKQNCHVRLIDSKATKKSYMPIGDLALLLGSSAPRFSKHKACYHWNTEKDGEPLESSSRTQSLMLYFEVTEACRLFFNEKQAKEFAEWVCSPPPPASRGAGAVAEAIQKRERPEICEADSDMPVRKRLATPPSPPPPQGAAGMGASPSPYEQIVRDWFAENKSLLQEQAIERLMQKEEVRREAIERVAKELALAARPTAQEMIQKLFEANSQ